MNDKPTRQLTAALRRRVRYAAGRWRGMRYHLGGHHPAVAVDDGTLADRIRSSLGPLEKRLDVPHVHVLVHDRTARLHGVVPTWRAADRLFNAVLRVSGVEGIESYLHIGPTRADTTPSVGRRSVPPSPALRRLLDAATRSGSSPHRATAAVRAVLSTFAERLPAGECDRVLAHLPADARLLAAPPRRVGERPRERTVPELVAEVSAYGIPGGSGLRRDNAVRITESVIATLRELVPEEAGYVAAALPSELRDFWNAAVPA
jgi:uncharacterized protein (DUF2267 family)